MKTAAYLFLSFLIIALQASTVVQAATADDVECIRCVDTTDINYNAVTSNRILDGTIRNADLGLDAVTSSRIKAGEVRTSDLAPNAVTTSRIMNGAVTETKLAQALLDRINQLESKLASLEAENAAQQAILDFFSLEDLHDPSTGNYYPTVRVTGANLQVVNGLNDTETANGTGNLIVGYNQLAGIARCSDGNHEDETSCTGAAAIWSAYHRSGSHNIVTGERNNYSKHGGLIAGIYNTINANFASVSGGIVNTASSYTSSVAGGYGNDASGSGSSVLGGFSNTASKAYSSVLGGSYNNATGTYSSISGGYSNNASNDNSSVSGGAGNSATGTSSSISGGISNTASANYSSVSGGYLNAAGGVYGSVSGGFNRSVSGDYDWAAGSLFETQ